VTVVTGHTERHDDGYFRRLANPELSLVVLMGVAARSSIATQLIQGGLSDETPVAVIESAWTTRESVTRSVLRELGSLDVASPAIIVIGPCACSLGARTAGRDVRAGLGVLPLTLKLSDKDVLVIGAGRIARQGPTARRRRSSRDDDRARGSGRTTARTGRVRATRLSRR